SMASPVAAGVAAIIRGYFPELTAEQVRDVLMKTVSTTSKKIAIPGRKKADSVGAMNDVSISAGFINAERAVSYLLSKEKK
ncbi:MAG: S8 family serine peptidase, partial [Crocinitomicaceae bacterium]|nr:S8 family serine peptidase [Crocinitomicaceae bacterium]